MKISINSVYGQIKTRALKDRIIMGLSGLLFLFVFPIALFRLFSLDWAIFLVDLYLVISAALIFVNTYKRKHVKIARIYMCLLVTLGSSLSVIVNGPQQFYWVYPASLTMFFLVSNKVAFFLVFLICGFTVPVMYGGLDGMHLATPYIALFGSSMFIFVFSSEIRQENSQLDTLVNIDFLTKCGNRRAFDIQVQSRIEEYEKHNHTSSLIILDLDDFKVLNDTYGHAVGDSVLCDLSNSIRTRLRKSDELYRLGGEEFAVIISNADENEAKKIADEIIQTIRDNKSHELPFYTVSMGVAGINNNESFDTWLDRADQAMYQAKRTGKNKVILASDT